MLQAAIPSHPQDPFLLNNLGYTMEAIGDTEGALRSYSAAASLHSTKPVIVTPRLKWRGRPISEVAAENATALSRQIAQGEGDEAATARLNLRGVAALNDNNPSAAKTFFLQAYQHDASNAFTLNNLGYISEMSGDRESAQMYYEAARTGRDANAKVSYATRRDAEGRKIDTLADTNQSDVEATPACRPGSQAPRPPPHRTEAPRRHLRQHRSGYDARSLHRRASPRQCPRSRPRIRRSETPRRSQSTHPSDSSREAPAAKRHGSPARKCRVDSSEIDQSPL